MLNLNRRFVLPAAAIFMAWRIATPASAATIGEFGDSISPEHGVIQSSQAVGLRDSRDKIATDMSVVSSNGRTYHIALESDKFSTVQFTNRLFLSDSLGSSDINREMQIADNVDLHQKLLFTSVKTTTATTNENLDILPTDVKLYLKAASSDIRDILQIGGGDDNGGYRDITNAVSINESANYVEKEQIEEKIIVSREYGGVSGRAVNLGSGTDDSLAAMMSMLFSQTAFFAVISSMMLLSLMSRVFGRSRVRRS
jgi:hypothetical protein